MKKLIKLLFPKTYNAIHSDGYNACEEYYNPDRIDYSDEEHYEEEYHPDYDEFLDEYPESYWEETEILYEESEVGAAAINIPKLAIGDKIHLNSKNGIYTITDMYIDSFAYKTSRAKTEKYADYSDYKCHAGGIYNKGE
jgi:hypothetical protein